MDVLAAVEASWTIGRISPFASLGYQMVGSRPDLPLRSGWNGSLGAIVPVGRSALVLSYDDSHNLVAGPRVRELTAVYAHPLSGGWTVSVIGSKGLSRGASNLMTGLALTRRFRA